MGSVNYNCTKNCIDKFIDADIAVAELIFDEGREARNVASIFSAKVKQMDLKDLIKVKQKDGKVYLVNLTKEVM